MYLALGLSVAFAVLYYRAGELEAGMGGRNHGVLWAVASLAVSALGFGVLGGGALLCLILQGALLIGIAGARSVSDALKSEQRPPRA